VTTAGAKSIRRGGPSRSRQLWIDFPALIIIALQVLPGLQGQGCVPLAALSGLGTPTAPSRYHRRLNGVRHLAALSNGIHAGRVGRNRHGQSPLTEWYHCDWERIMSTKKVVELLAESPSSWEDAAQKAVDDASKSLRGIASVYIKEFEARVENNRVTSYRINAKVTFEVEQT
jgi:dodecin